MSIKFTEPTLTKQSFASQCDINSIVERYRTTGLVSHVSSKVPFYGDVSGVTDYRAAVEMVDQARASFMELCDYWSCVGSC